MLSSDSALPFAMISRRAATRLTSGHVWAYRSDVTRVEPEEAPAGLMAVQDPAGRLLGTALWSPTSQIALRLVTRGAVDADAWAQLLSERLDRALARRESLLSPGPEDQTDSCRLVFSDADELPGLVIDRYAGIAVLQVLVAALDTAQTRAAVAAALERNLGSSLSLLLERPDPRIRVMESLPVPPAEPLWAAEADASALPRHTVFHLNGLRFHFDADGGQKTGAFLDQRLNYRLAARYGHGDALDVCCYQGGFALHLAGVCRSVVGLDTSAAALEIAASNLELNRDRLGSIPITWEKGDAFEQMRAWSDAGESFDTIVLDPPAFAKSQRAAENALRGYKELNLRAFQMLRPGGILLTCSCSHHVSLADFQAAVASAAADAGRTVRMLERTGAAPDHPVLLTVPETEYLKCLVLEVDWDVSAVCSHNMHPS